MTIMLFYICTSYLTLYKYLNDIFINLIPQGLDLVSNINLVIFEWHIHQFDPSRFRFGLEYQLSQLTVDFRIIEKFDNKDQDSRYFNKI